MGAMPQPGDPAPPFDLESTAGGRLTLDDLKGSRTLLFFFPKASTPGWTIEARGFRDALQSFEELGARVVGVSKDKLRSQQRFAESSGLTFPLLADPEGEAIRAYGVGGLLGVAKRVSFLIDAEGKIAKVYEKVAVKEHAGEVLEDLRASD